MSSINHSVGGNAVEEVGGSSVPPADRGIRAWCILWAAFLVQGIQWGAFPRTHGIFHDPVLPFLLCSGFALNYGVFESYYSASAGPFHEDERLPVVGVMATGIVHLGLPLMSPLVDRYAENVKLYLVAGSALQICGLVAASFAKNTPTLIATQGLLYSTGELLLYLPLLSVVNEWFENRRGLAYGILDGATGISGVALPFIVQQLLSRYGAPTTLRVFAVTIFITALPAVTLIRSRRRPSEPEKEDGLSATRAPKTSLWRILKLRHVVLFRITLFHVYSISTILQGLAFYLPLLFLPSYATVLGISPTLGALLVSLLSAAQAIGQFTFGYLSDRRDYPPHFLMLISSAVAGVVTFLLWGLGDNIGLLCAYALLYGFFASGFGVIWARISMKLAPDDDPASALSTYALFAAQRGLGNVSAGLVSQALVPQSPTGRGNHGDRIQRRNSFGTGAYTGLIGFTGTCMVLSAAVVAAAHFLPKR